MGSSMVLRTTAFIKSFLRASHPGILSPRTDLRRIVFVLALIAVSGWFEFSGSAGVAYGAACGSPGKDGPATISGIVNSYYPGSASVAAGATSIPVGAIDARGAPTAIASGDLLLVIQMQDADINSTNNATYGNNQNAGSGYTALNQTGLYEYVTATGVVAAGLVPIQGSGAGNGLVNSYRVRAYVAGTNGQSTFQVIRVPQYSAATVAAATTVTAPSWNGGTGGVIVMDVAGTLTIDGTIDANGLGFRGGMGRQHGGDTTYLNTDYRQFSSANLGIGLVGAHASKGEGIAGTPRYVNRPAVFNGVPAQTDTGVEGYPNGSYGRGAPANAGGGGTDGHPQGAPATGNDQNSGGGGGANYGWGGKGGNSWNSNIIVGGEGGSYVTGLAYNRVIQGGGGGAGTTNNGTGENLTFTNPLGLACDGTVYTTGQCSSGAPGGGVIILRTKVFLGSGFVLAEGGNGYNVGNDSAGGGGAGGSIVLDSQIGGVVTASVKGGDGGNAWRNGGTTLADRHGPGGGGGGGFIAYSPMNGLVVLATVAGGINGKSTTLADYYGTTTSDGGITIFENPTVSGPQSAAACLPVLTVSKSTTTPTISVLPGVAAYTISVTNDTGKSTAQQVVISDALPGVPSLFTNASAAPTISYNPNAAPCNTSRTSTTNAATGISTPAWSSWDIPSGCTVNLTFNATVPAGTVPTTYQNPATATYLDPERTTPTGTRSMTYNPSSSTAEDVTVRVPPALSKSFGSATISAGGTTTVVLTLTNYNTAAITAVGFTDTLPTAAAGAPGNMTIVNPPVPSTTCGGAPVYTAVNGSGSFTVSGITIPASSSCTVSFTITAPTTGIYVNTIPAGALASSTGSNLNPATAALTVGPTLQPPSMTKSFLTNPIQIGGTTTLRFTLTNPNGVNIGSAGFIDTLPTEIVVASTPNVVNTCGGTVTATAGSNFISLNTNGTIPASASCTVSVDVTGRSAGLFQNTSAQVVGDTGPGNRASDNLRVMAPVVVAKSFDTNPVVTSTATVLRITLTNPNSIAVTGATFTDTYPLGLVNTATPSPATTCGGTPTLTAAAGGSSLAVGGTGATIPANSSCVVTVNVQAALSGSYTNSTGTVSTTNAGTAPSASSTLNVLSPPLVRKVFIPEIISNGGQSGMQIIISNPSLNATTLTGVALSDTYTGNMTNAAAGSVLCTDGSSATLTGGANGGTTVGISGGSILPGGSCLITQLVTATTNNTNTTSAPTSTNGGTGVAATAVLKIMQPLLVSKSFSNSHPAANTDVTMTIRFVNPNPDIVKNIAFTDTYPANLVNSTVAPNPTFIPANCMGTNATLTAATGGGSLSLSSSLMSPNSTCDITVLVRLNANNISRLNATGTVTTANAGTSPGDSATISDGTGVAPVQLTKTFTPSTINVGQTSTLQFTITNPTGGAAPANTIAFTDVLPPGLTAPNGVTNNVCGGGSVLTITGNNNIALTLGAIATTPTTCTFSVTVTGTAAGSYVNRTGQITATGQTGNYAEATIQVQNPPSVGKSFGNSYLSPGTSIPLTIRIDNPNVAAITTSANFTDLFPTSPGVMTLADGFVTNNTCSLPLTDTNGVGLITPVGVGADLSNSTVASATGATNQTMTGAYTVNCGSNRLLIVVVEIEAANIAHTFAINTATYGGQNLTQLYLTPAGVRNRIYVGYLKEAGIAAAASTTLTVTFTNPNAPSWMLMKAGYFTGVDQTNPFTTSGGNLYVANFNDTTANNFNFGGTALTVVNNGRAMYFSMFNGNTTATPPAGFTELFDHVSDAGNNFSTEGGYKVITANGTETGNTINLSATVRYGVVGLALQPFTAYSGTGAGVRVACGTSIPAGGCEFTVNVTATTAGVYTNTIAAGALQTNAGNNANAVSATLVVPKLAPLVTKTFVPASINAGGTSTLLITFENPNAVPISLTSLFTDTFPSGVVTAGAPNRATTCSGGTAGGAAGTVTLSSGAIIPAGTFAVPGSCTLQVDVTAAASGIYTNTIPAGDLQTTAGNNASAVSAVLTVSAISPATVSKAFDAVAIGNTGLVSKLTLTLSNTNPGTATLTANLDDNLPANLVIATPNGLSGTCTLGSVTATAGGTQIRYASGATIPSGGCTIAVNVTSSIVATYTNTIAAGALQTNLGNNPGPTSDTISVYVTLVTVSNFTAYEEDGQVVVEWTTESEVGTAGFYLYRLNETTGEYHRLNRALLPGLITAPQGGTYRLIDHGASLSESTSYKLIEIESSGKQRSYGPFTVGADIKPNGFKSLQKSDSTVVHRPEVLSEGTVSNYTRESHGISEAKERRIAARKAAQKVSQSLQMAQVGEQAKIAVQEDGLYRLTSSGISAVLGIPELQIRNMIKNNQLSLSNQGQKVAYFADNDSSGIYFYGQGIDSIYTQKNIYWLKKEKGLEMRLAGGKGPSPAAGNETFTETLHFEEDHVVATGIVTDPTADYWFWDYVVSGDPQMGSKTFALRAEGVAPVSGAASLSIGLRGLTEALVSQEHHAVFTLNGTKIGETLWEGTRADHAVTFSFSQDLLTGGDNTLEVRGSLDPGVPYSIFFINFFDVTYQRLYQAVGNALVFMGDTNQTVSVSGFTDPDIGVFEVTDSNRPTLIRATTIDGAAGNFRVSFTPTSGEAMYLAVSRDAIHSVGTMAASSPSRLKERSNSGEYLLITTSGLKDVSGSLAVYRGSQGLTTMVVDLEDIMDEFNYGIYNPKAIRDFLSYAYQNWKKPPRYVVLAGDGTFDYKNNLGYGDSLIPPMMVGTPDGLFPSDNYFVDRNGDHVPEIAIGRLPAGTSGELQGVIKKIITYETTLGGAWEKRIVVLADIPEVGGPFTDGSDDVVALLPAGYTPVKIYLSERPLDEARWLLLNEINNGVGFMYYRGHGGLDRLSQGGLLLTSDVSSMTNTRKFPILTAMTCVVGQFSLPGYDSLAEALVMKDNGGAVAVWAPTGLSIDSEAAILDRAFYRNLFEKKKQLLGDVIVKTLKEYSSNGKALYMMDIYNLLGDPALRIRGN